MTRSSPPSRVRCATVTWASGTKRGRTATAAPPRLGRRENRQANRSVAGASAGGRSTAIRVAWSGFDVRIAAAGTVARMKSGTDALVTVAGVDHEGSEGLARHRARLHAWASRSGSSSSPAIVAAPDPATPRFRSGRRKLGHAA